MFGYCFFASMELKDIKAIIDLMRKNGLSEFELERSDFKIKLKRPLGVAPATVQDDQTVIPFPAGGASVPTVMPTVIPPPIAAPPAATPSVDIKSPMIGTFYRAPSPESADYVEIGTEVNPETVVCLIEAMKVMNEIKAEAKGVITHILVENAKPVEFGQPLFRLRPT